MNQHYEEVPKIITGKDLDYLSDMFQWNYGPLKKANAAIKEVSDPELIVLFNKALKLFKDNLESTLRILDNGGSNE